MFTKCKPKKNEEIQLMDYSKLRGKIAEKFKTNENFAAAMGISASTLSLKMSGTRPWRHNEIIKACRILDISADEIAEYFFSELVYNM